MTTVNLNQQIKCKFTKNGKDVYKKYLEQFGKTKETEVLDEVVMPLWEFTNIFGHEMYMGNINLPYTENNSIELVYCFNLLIKWKQYF